MLSSLIIFKLNVGSSDPVDDFEIIWLDIKHDLAFLNTPLPLMQLKIAKRKILMRCKFQLPNRPFHLLLGGDGANL